MSAAPRAIEISSASKDSSTRNHSPLSYAVKLIEAVSCVSASSTFVESLRSDDTPAGLSTAVAHNDTPGLFNWIMDSFSYQGISNRVAQGYLDLHGNVTWLQIKRLLSKGPSCPRLKSYWNYEGCRYDKSSGCCSEPDHIENCSVPHHRLRNGRLNQTAYSLYLFIRDLARDDLPGWIDSQLNSISDTDANYAALAHEALVGPMRHIFGVSDKVITMTLSEILMSAPSNRHNWFRIGSQMIVVDTLVHNFLHRTGILRRFDADHSYGPACYHSGHCADILRAVASQIDARRFNREYPENFRDLFSTACGTTALLMARTCATASILMIERLAAINTVYSTVIAINLG